MESSIFTTWHIGPLSIKNRLIRSATNMRCADANGNITDTLINIHGKLTDGGVGLDITGHACISWESRIHEGQIGCHHDSLIDSMRSLIRTVRAGDTRILLQISHGGRRSIPVGMAVSPGASSEGFEIMSPEDIEKAISDFISSALRAEDAGFDGVQIHAAHGYFLSELISPLSNVRGDKYGGRKGGTSVLKRIVSGIRAVATKDFIIAIKIGTDDHEGGNQKEDLSWILSELIPAGLDCVEISKGYTTSDSIVRKGIVAGKNEAYNLDDALYIKSRLPSLPLIVVGGILTMETAESIVDRGIDAVALCRPLIIEPDLPRRWMTGNRSPSQCRTCSRCLTDEGPVRCRISKE